MTELRMVHVEIVFVTDHPATASLRKVDAQRMIDLVFGGEHVRGRYYAKVARPPYIRKLPGCPLCTSSTCPTLTTKESQP